MPTQSTTYNSRVTDESLEKRFRDTFRSQGGAELVDDLYAQGVIVPIVDFTAAATGQQLAQNLQTAWDFTTGHALAAGSSATLISNAGFWLVDSAVTLKSAASIAVDGKISISDGLSTKIIWEISESDGGTEPYSVATWTGVVFLRAGDSLSHSSSDAKATITTSYRQIATVNGDLVNPSGFTSS